ncbi:unnamed protein product [Prorocentrum cordatum]|uniref:Uncharacterized protein n=1 Tax=Prorocentrum cordatum TaxID=2364126 RepID=A0ABN9SVS5_9DINO|nr:unnamed protein product [Polarella glacialis]
MASCTSSEIRADLEGLPSSAFNGADEASRQQWMDTVLGAEVNPRSKHDVRFYTGVARLLADTVHSTQPEDFADEYVREVIKTGFRPGDLPFASEGNPESWKAFKVTPAMVACALRVQAACAGGTAQAQRAGGSSGAGDSDDGFKEAVKEFVKAQTEQATKHVKKGLSFSLAERTTEVGLGLFPKQGLPSEELLAKWETAGKAAADRGRLYVGCFDGDDYQAVHRPFWSRSPKIDAIAGHGSLEDKLKETLEMKKSRSVDEKMQYPSFATFLGHVLTWGLKLVLMRTCSQTHLLSFVYLLTRVAEEHGGAFTAYHYDLLVRKAMAQKLEHEEGDVLHFFLKLDQDLLSEAKGKAVAGASKAAKFNNSKGGGSAASNSKGGGKGGGKTAVKGESDQPRAPTTPRLARSRSRPRKEDRNKKSGWGKDGWHGKSWTNR